MEAINEQDQGVLRPVERRVGGVMGAPVPAFSRGQCEIDLMSSGRIQRDAERLAAAYFETFALSARDGRPGAVDAAGTWRPIPDSTVRLETLNIEGPQHTSRMSGLAYQRRWLRFVDAGGTTTLLLPGYGWDWMLQLEPWAAENHWTADLQMTVVHEWQADTDKRAPGYSTAPRIDVGEKYHEHAKRSWWRRG